MTRELFIVKIDILLGLGEIIVGKTPQQGQEESKYALHPDRTNIGVS